MYGRLMESQRFAAMGPKDRSDRLRAVMQSVRFMAPRLIAINAESYAEQQRLKADAELRDGLLLPLPILLVVIGGQFSQTPIIARVVLYSLAMATFAYLFVDGRKMWRTSNSWIAHGVCESEGNLDHLISRATIAAELHAKTLPAWAARLHDFRTKH